MEKLFIQIKSNKRDSSDWNYLFIYFSTVILNEGNKYRLKLKNVGLKDNGDISFQCGDLKDNCKITVKESM
jgi:hypothetical protein